MWEILFLAIIGSMVAVWRFFPDIVIYAGYVATAIMIGIVVGSIFIPSYIGRGHPHIFHFFLSWPNLIPYYRSMFVESEETEPLGKVYDITPLMDEDQRGYEIPKWWGERWYWPYLIKTAYGVDIPRYGSVEFQVLILPAPMKSFMEFKEMPWGAELFGELFTHPATAWLVSMMAPFTVKHLGLELPVFLGVAANKTATKISADWARTMREAAKYLGEFEAIMEQNKEDIYPFTEIEMIGADLLGAKGKARLEEALGKKKLAPAPVAK